MALKIKRLDPNTPLGRRLRALRVYLEARAAAEHAEELRRKAESELMHVLEEQELKSTTAVVDDVKYTVSVTSRTTTSFDESGLKKALGARNFNKLTVAKLDKGKLSAAIDEGQVDPAVVSQFTTISQSARSLRLTKKVADDEAEEA